MVGRSIFAASVGGKVSVSTEEGEIGVQSATERNIVNIIFCVIIAEIVTEKVYVFTINDELVVVCVLLKGFVNIINGDKFVSFVKVPRYATTTNNDANAKNVHPLFVTTSSVLITAPFPATTLNVR